MQRQLKERPSKQENLVTLTCGSAFRVRMLWPGLEQENSCPERSLCVKVLFVLLNRNHKTKLVFQFSFISHDMYKNNTHRNIYTNSFKVLH